MSLIIPFSAVWPKPQAKRIAPRDGVDADILFFTGVRYARRDATAAGGEDGDRPRAGQTGNHQRTRRRKASRT